jgi:hypothetical protein
LSLLEGHEVVVITEPSQKESVNASVSLSADTVRRANGGPRLLPRGNAFGKGGDEAVSDYIGNRDFGAGGGGDEGHNEKGT